MGVDDPEMASVLLHEKATQICVASASERVNFIHPKWRFDYIYFRYPVRCQCFSFEIMYFGIKTHLLSWAQQKKIATDKSVSCDFLLHKVVVRQCPMLTGVQQQKQQGISRLPAAPGGCPPKTTNPNLNK